MAFACERAWQSLRNLAYSFLNHARLGTEFGDMAFEYAWRVFSVLPKKSADGAVSTSYRDYYGRKPPVRKFRTFGCPCFYKTYDREKKDPKTGIVARYNSSTHPQRGLPGIFCGFPRGQAGWLIFDPRSKTLRVSADVVFDESFSSLGPAGHFAFKDAVPVFTSDTWQSDPAKFVSTVPENDHYGPPLTSYLEDTPSDGFPLASKYDPSFELISTDQEEEVLHEAPEILSDDFIRPPIFEEEFASGDSNCEPWSEEENVSPPPVDEESPPYIPSPDVEPSSAEPISPPNLDSQVQEESVPAGDEFIYRDIIAPLPRRTNRCHKPRMIFDPSNISSFIDHVMSKPSVDTGNFDKF